MASLMASPPPCGAPAAARWRRSRACASVLVGAAGQDDRHARAEHDAGDLRPAARYSSCLASMLPASRSGTTKMSAWPATGETMPLVLAASSETALSKASGPSRMPPVIWPRSAILHSAAASIVDLIFGGHGLHRGQDRDVRVAHAERMRKVDRVLHDVDLVLQRRIDVDRGVGDEQRPRIAGHVDDEDMAHAPGRAQPVPRRRSHA